MVTRADPGKTERNRAFRARNPGYAAAASRICRASRPGQAAKASRGWRERNPGSAARATQSYKQQHPAWVLWSAAKDSAKKRGQDVELTLAEVEELLAPMRCSVTGLPLRWDTSVAHDLYAPSLDRIENSNGYVKGNVQLVCWGINRARGPQSMEDFLIWLRMVCRSMGLSEEGE